MRTLKEHCLYYRPISGSVAEFGIGRWQRARPMTSAIDATRLPGARQKVYKRRALADLYLYLR